MAPQDSGHVHYHGAGDVLQRYDLQFIEERIDLGRGLGLNGAHHYVLAAFGAAPGLVQHTKGFSDPGGIAHENLELAAPFVGLLRLGLLQKLVGSSSSSNSSRHSGYYY